MTASNPPNGPLDREVRQLREYLRKASFASNSDRFSALECLAEIEKALGIPNICPTCKGSGWMMRDPDIGTDQECFICDGTGIVNA